jgi:protein-glucosylgalactosylhydroxylysine glucosidase
LSSPSVGSGEYVFTVDVRRLQSFPEYYENGVPLGTQSQWGWHAIPPDQDYHLKEVYQYDTSCTGKVISFPVEYSKGSKGAAAN